MRYRNEFGGDRMHLGLRFRVNEEGVLACMKFWCRVALQSAPCLVEQVVDSGPTLGSDIEEDEVIASRSIIPEVVRPRPHSPLGDLHAPLAG